MHSIRIFSIIVFLSASSLIEEGAAEAPSLHVGPGNVALHRILTWHPTQRQLSRHRRAENEDASEAKRRRSIIAALDAYFGFSPPPSNDAGAGVIENFTSKRSAVKAIALDSEGQRHSKKKDLIQGTIEMMMPAEGHDGSAKGAEMPVVVFTDDSAYDNMAMSEEERKKMTAMVDHMLSDMMHSDLMKSFNMDSSLPSLMNGHHNSDFVHSIDHPIMEDFNHPHLTNSTHPPEKSFLVNSTGEPSHLSPAGGNFASENDPSTDTAPSASTSNGATAAAHSNFNPELEFTTLEVDLGPAILPLQVPEGYFVPFVPRKAFGVANGVARPPHGHASFYVHRPAGLVDVPNSPAFGFLFSGHSRSPDIESATTTPTRWR